MKPDLDCNIALALKNIAETLPEETGLVCKKGDGYQSWTFEQLYGNSCRFARGLNDAGVRPGTRVMLMVPPSMEFVCLTFALFKLGAIVILIDPAMGYKNLLSCIGRVCPDVLVGIPKANLFSRIFPRPFKSLRKRICVGSSFGILGTPLKSLCIDKDNDTGTFAAVRDDLAAIIFTSGSTGSPKGVQFTHGIFRAQLEIIGSYYNIRPGDVDQPGFPLFALFSTALGAKAVIPDMDPAHPAKVDPARFIKSILDHKVTYSFGSPAIWNVVSRYCLEQKITLPVRKILMAGAPVPGELIDRVKKIMPDDGTIHTPYGATECLPIVSITGSEILEQTWSKSRQGCGICVGFPLPGMDLKIIKPSDGSIAFFQEAVEFLPGEIGEIIVRGPVVTRAYDHNDKENRASKIADGDTFWHRIGDMGYLDDQGRLWFCGRKAHRVLGKSSVMYTIPCEAMFNEHPEVFRSALVGVGEPGEQRPVLIVELDEGAVPSISIREELLGLAERNDLTREINTFLVHPSFPVDIRHNAKILREKLAVWAEDQLCDDG